MTKEELLRPRYKIIALWPFEPKTSIGNIFTRPDQYARVGQWSSMWHWWDELANHPHLFEPLPWWKDRKLEDMPEYVKVIETPDQKLIKGSVMKIIWINDGWGRSESGEVFPYTNCFEPATSEEYEAYMQTTKTVK